MKCRLVREQRTVCSESYMESDIYPITPEEHKRPRGKKSRESCPVQQNLNGENARRYLVQLVAANFTAGDISWCGNYDNAHRPKTPEQADSNFQKFVRRVNYACHKKGGENLKYIEVTEWSETVNFHHHAILSCCLTRDEIEALWYGDKRGKNEEPDTMGYTNADRLQWYHGSVEGLAKYITKYANRKRRWRQSRGLKKPDRKKPADSKWKKRQLERICKDGTVYDPDYWMDKYKGWLLGEAVPRYFETTGEWRITVKLYKTAEMLAREKAAATTARRRERVADAGAGEGCES